MEVEKPYLILTQGGSPVTFTRKNEKGEPENYIFFSAKDDAIREAKRYVTSNGNVRLYLAKLTKFIGSPIEVLDVE